MMSCQHVSEGTKCGIEAGADVNSVEGDINRAGSDVSSEGADVNIALAYVNRKFSRGKYKGFTTRLISACEHGHHKCVKALITAGADVNKLGGDISNLKETSALIAAGERGYEQCVDLLIQAGADVNMKVDFLGYTALVETAKRGSARCLELLLKAQDNNRITNGHEGLDSSEESSSMKNVLTGVKRKRDVFEEEASGGISNGHFNRENVDTDTTAWPNKSTGDKRDRNINEVEDGIDMSDNMAVAQNKIELTTALLAAAANNNCECLEILVKSGADVNMIDDQMKSPLMYAAGNRCEQCVNILLKAGADVNYMDKFNYTALICAVQKGAANCVNILLDAGADVNIVHNFHMKMKNSAGKFEKGETALSWATYFMQGKEISDKDKLRIFKSILRAGANVNTKTCEDETILEAKLAECSDREILAAKHREAVLLLFAAGCKADNLDIEDLPEYLMDVMKSDGTLKDLCRRVIRKQLIEDDKNVNLFKSIPALHLSPQLSEYLLYNMFLLNC